MATDLTRIGEKARKEPDLVFTSLYHHISDVDNLRACCDNLGARKATGVDGVTKEEYGRNLEENLRDLSVRLKRMGYRPAPSRRSYIPKTGSEKGRPLGISCLEDKIVESAIKRTLEPISEAAFEDSKTAGVVLRVNSPGGSPVQAGIVLRAAREHGERAEEAAIRRRAGELLHYVGIADRADDLARHLSYGDQRRLERREFR